MGCEIGVNLIENFEFLERILMIGLISLSSELII